MINLCLWLLAGILVSSAANRLSSALAPDDAAIHSIAGILEALFGGMIFLIFDITALHTVSIWGVLLALISAAISIALARLVFST